MRHTLQQRTSLCVVFAANCKDNLEFVTALLALFDVNKPGDLSRDQNTPARWSCCQRCIVFEQFV